MASRAAAIAFLVAALACQGATADEGIYPLVASGDWIAMAHRQSITAPPDVCVAANLERGVAFRADGDGVQLRVSDNRWSLPAGTRGTVTVTVGGWSQSFEIAFNTSDSVSAKVAEDVASDLLARMDKAATMSVTVGKAKPFQVSLGGSTKVTNAFMTCAGIKGHSQVPGTNPFE